MSVTADISKTAASTIGSGDVSKALRGCDSLDRFREVISSAHPDSLYARYRTDLRSSLLECRIRIDDDRVKDAIAEFLDRSKSCTESEVDGVISHFQQTISNLVDDRLPPAPEPDRPKEMLNPAAAKGVERVLELWERRLGSNVDFKTENVIGILTRICETKVFPPFMILADAIRDSNCDSTVDKDGVHRSVTGDIQYGAFRETIEILAAAAETEDSGLTRVAALRRAIREAFSVVESPDSGRSISLAQWTDPESALWDVRELFNETFPEATTLGAVPHDSNAMTMLRDGSLDPDSRLEIARDQLRQTVSLFLDYDVFRHRPLENFNSFGRADEASMEIARAVVRDSGGVEPILDALRLRHAPEVEVVLVEAIVRSGNAAQLEQALQSCRSEEAQSMLLDVLLETTTEAEQALRLLSMTRNDEAERRVADFIVERDPTLHYLPRVLAAVRSPEKQRHLLGAEVGPYSEIAPYLASVLSEVEGIDAPPSLVDRLIEHDDSGAWSARLLLNTAPETGVHRYATLQRRLVDHVLTNDLDGRMSRAILQDTALPYDSIVKLLARAGPSSN